MQSLLLIVRELLRALDSESGFLGLNPGPTVCPLASALPSLSFRFTFHLQSWAKLLWEAPAQHRDGVVPVPPLATSPHLLTPELPACPAQL